MLRRIIQLGVLGCTLTAFLSAQEGGITESETDFYEKKLKATKVLRGQLFKGEVVSDPNNKAHIEAIDVAAKEITYPLYWQGRSLKAGGTNPSPLLKDTVDELDNRLRSLSRNKEPSTVAAAQALFTKAVVQRANEVILAGPPISSVNAARLISMLPQRLPGQTSKDWVAEVMPRMNADAADQILSTAADLIAADPKRLNDGVRYYLLRAAHDVLALPPQRPAIYKQATVDKVIQSAMTVASRRFDFPKATPRGEVEGFKILRAEALRVLAWAPTPSMGTDRPALVLARVAASDQSVNPPPRVEELVESSIGLCRLIAASGKSADFNADYAAQQVARAISAIGIEANKNIEVKSPTLRLRPWKVDGARLLEAIELIQSNKDPYITEMVKQTRPLLLDLEAGRVTQAANLGTWANGDTKPAGNSLYKGGEPSEVKPRSVSDE